jgi:hypothetical protein
LAGCRLQLIWQLVGDTYHAKRILQVLEANPKIGLVIPNYHPIIAPHINWVNNYSIAEKLANTIELPAPDEI